MKPKKPVHIAMIMDGNGRWACQNNYPRIKGHEKGVTVVKTITEYCANIDIKYLTLYAFSAENWKRPRHEVDFLMKLLREYLIGERETLMKNNIVFETIGRIHELSDEVVDEIEINKSMTSCNTGLTLCLALNYGGRQEITDSAKKLAADVQSGKLNLNEIDEKVLAGYLYCPDIPDPDILIRTGGEVRVSNFLLWQLSYTEIWITPTYWPDFTTSELDRAIEDFAKRERRFGGL